MLRRLRIKFICINMCFVLLLLCVAFGFVFQFMSRNLEMESVQLMQAIAARPFRDAENERFPFHSVRPTEAHQETRLPYFAVLVDANGDILRTEGHFDLSDEAALEEILSLAAASSEPIGDLKAFDLRFSRVDTPKETRYIFMDTSSEQATLRNLAQSCLLIGALSFLAFFLVSLFLAQWAVKPVEKAWQQQKQFVADASHELKTPLTVILTNAELLQECACGNTSVDQFSSNILTMSHQMKGLVESLLVLARVDSGLSPQSMIPVDFDRLVTDALLPFEPLYFEQGLTLDGQITPSLRVKGSASHLLQVVTILLDNAIKYSVPPGKVTVKLIRQGNSCLLSVSNPAPPISQEDLKQIFKRFYRVDKARTMKHSYGLGLSIAERIVQEHKGRIWAESSSGRNTFWVQLPLFS